MQPNECVIASEFYVRLIIPLYSTRSSPGPQGEENCHADKMDGNARRDGDLGVPRDRSGGPRTGEPFELGVAGGREHGAGVLDWRADVARRRLLDLPPERVFGGADVERVRRHGQRDADGDRLGRWTVQRQRARIVPCRKTDRPRAERLLWRRVDYAVEPHLHWQRDRLTVYTV